MASITLKATRREVTGKKVRAMRREGLLPAVLYGHAFSPTPITLDMHAASRILGSLGSSSIITIDLEGEELNALVRDKQRDTLKGMFLHIDFQVVSMTETIQAPVAVHLVGIAPAVKDYNGIVEQLINEIEVEALPAELPGRFVVDVSGLKNVGDHILVKDLALPSGVEVLTDADEIIVTIAASTTGAEEEAMTAEGALSEPEVIEKGKRDEEGEKD